MSFTKFDYDAHARTCDSTDLWGQVKRTTNGKAIDDAQVALIVSAILAGLRIENKDVVLDIGCGNGALTDRIVAECRGGHGVDVSEYLIGVALATFGQRRGTQYSVGNAAKFVTLTGEVERFTKVLWYGALMYFSDDDVRTILKGLRQRFRNVTRCFIGNVSDKSRMHNFYYRGEYTRGMEASHETVMGRWRSEDEMIELAESTGWSATIDRMSPAFAASVFKYDVVLTPNACF